MIDVPGKYSFPALCISLFLAGCASQPQSYVVLLENTDQTAGTIIVKGPKGEHVVNTARHGMACLWTDRLRPNGSTMRSCRRISQTLLRQRPRSPCTFCCTSTRAG